ncbi:MAG: hypothetical protein HYX87_06615 [Chloroflexi bacterium]|nr:hypothetical protein [Chloroflexota bacterium]
MSEKPIPLIILGAAFFVIGLVLLIVGIREENAYRAELIGRPDMREFLTGWPPRSWRHTLTMGGVVGMVVGAVLLIMSIFLW